MFSEPEVDEFLDILDIVEAALENNLRDRPTRYLESQHNRCEILCASHRSVASSHAIVCGEADVLDAKTLDGGKVYYEIGGITRQK